MDFRKFINRIEQLNESNDNVSFVGKTTLLEKNKSKEELMLDRSRSLLKEDATEPKSTSMIGILKEMRDPKGLIKASKIFKHTLNEGMMDHDRGTIQNRLSNLGLPTNFEEYVKIETYEPNSPGDYETPSYDATYDTYIIDREIDHQFGELIKNPETTDEAREAWEEIVRYMEEYHNP